MNESVFLKCAVLCKRGREGVSAINAFESRFIAQEYENVFVDGKERFRILDFKVVTRFSSKLQSKI